MPLCSDRTLVNANSAVGEIAALKCKRWSCENCNADNRWRVMQQAKRGAPDLFMTLSHIEGSKLTPDEAARDMKRGLVLLRRMIERRFGIKNIPFIVVFEKTKKGWPHMHLLLRGPYMHWQVLRGMWKQITGAFEVDVRRIPRKEQVLFYITKYLGKDLHAFAGCKRWWKSQNYLSEPDDRPLPEMFGAVRQIERQDFHTLCRSYELHGWIVEQNGRYRARISRDRERILMKTDHMPWWHSRV